MSAQEARLAAATVLLLLSKQKKKKKRRSVWTREWILRRGELGVHQTLLSELRLEDRRQLDNFLRMTAEDFNFLLQLVGQKIAKNDTNMRQAISPSERLCVTLRFLGTGDSYHSLMYLFRIPVCTIGKIIPDCCQALFEVLKNQYLQTPKTPEEWLKHAKLFEELWNFPHCVGALDGKHICIQGPKDSGSYYYNYKGFNSIVLMALVDASYKFLYIDVGCNGRVSDGGVFNHCSLSTALMENTVKLPSASPLPGREQPMPYFVVADDAFALKPYLLKPYPFRGQSAPNRVFNYRLSRARRIVENVFGIIANRFRILRKPIELCPAKTTGIVSAICVLHNFLMDRRSELYAPPDVFDTDDTSGEWRLLGMPNSNLLQLAQGTSHNYSANAKAVRDEFRDFFVSPEGEVPWQYKYI